MGNKERICLQTQNTLAQEESKNQRIKENRRLHEKNQNKISAITAADGLCLIYHPIYRGQNQLIRHDVQDYEIVNNREYVARDHRIICTTFTVVYPGTCLSKLKKLVHIL